MSKLAWAAGLFEGEGSIGCYGERRSLQLKLKMTDREPVQRFADIFRVAVHGPYDPRCLGRDGRPHKLVYQVQVYGPAAQRIYRRLRRWLCSRRQEQGDRALARFEEQ